MVTFSTVRLKRLLYFSVFSLFAVILVIYESKHDHINANEDILPVLGVTLPNLDNSEYLPSTTDPCNPSGPKFVAFIHSSPTNIPYRDAIRKTWGSPTVQNIRTIFIVGRSKNEKIWKRVQKEAEDFGDLVVLPFLDSYKNLTLKHLLGLKWIIKHCPHVPYVLKADDDTFIDTKRLLIIADQFLGENSGSKDSLVCHVIPDGTPPKRSGKWMVSREEYPYDEFPEYCSGLAYFARLSTLKRIYDVASSGGVPYLSIDDVFITGLSADLANVKRQDLGVRFANTEVPVIEWLERKSLRPCPWMVAEISPYHWPKDASNLWNKTVVAWGNFAKHKSHFS